MPKTTSVRIAPPPTMAPKSSPNMLTIGISELRSTWRVRTRCSLNPIARAVRTWSSFIESSMLERSTRL